MAFVIDEPEFDGMTEDTLIDRVIQERATITERRQGFRDDASVASGNCLIEKERKKDVAYLLQRAGGTCHRTKCATAKAITSRCLR